MPPDHFNCDEVDDNDDGDRIDIKDGIFEARKGILLHFLRVGGLWSKRQNTIICT